MILEFSPVRMDGALNISRTGDALTLNGEVFDFAPLKEAQSLPVQAVDSDWVLGAVRKDGVLSVTLVLPHGPTSTYVDATQLVLDRDGPVTFPA